VHIRSEQGASQAEVLIPEIVRHIAGMAISRSAHRICMGQYDAGNEWMHWQLTGEGCRGVQIPIAALIGRSRLG